MSKLAKYLPVGLLALPSLAFAQETGNPVSEILSTASSVQTSVFAIVVTGVVFGVAIALVRMVKKGK